MTVTRRAHAVLTVKAVNDEERTIEGIASTPSTDRVGDIVEPLGAKFSLPLPFLWQHDSGAPIGHVVTAKPNKTGIPIKAKLAKIDEPGPLKDSIDHAWQAIKAGLVRGLSIGFSIIEHSVMENGGWRIMEWEWLELSAVTIPANAEATITNVKKFDTSAPAPSGIPVRPVKTAPPASGITIITPSNRPKEGLSQMNVGAQIAALEAKRGELAGQMETIQKASSEAGRTKTAEEREAFDKARDELRVVDAEIADLKDIEALTVAPTAKTVDHDGRGQVERRTVPATAKKDEPKGLKFARLAKVKARSRMELVPMLQVAEKMYGLDSETYHIVKAGEVAPGTSVSGNWAADLISPEGAAVADFAEYLNEGTILGKFGMNGVPALRRVSFRAPLLIQTEDGDGYWVGEAKPKPLTTFDFDRNTLTPLKCANICVLSMDHIRDSSPSSDLIVRDALRNALVKVQDVAFIDPANNGASNVKPAAITYQAPAIDSSGDDYTDVDVDVRSVMQKFIDTNNLLSSGVWIMSAANAVALANIRNELGQFVYTGIGINGGTFFQLPVIVSNHAGTNVVLVNAQDIHYGDDGDITVDMSREASLEMKAGTSNMTQDPLGPGTGASLVSLWQNNLVGLLAEKTVNWRRRRPVSVAYLTNVTWGGAVNVS